LDAALRLPVDRAEHQLTASDGQRLGTRHAPGCSRFHIYGAARRLANTASFDQALALSATAGAE